MINQYFIVNKNDSIDTVIQKILYNGHRGVLVVDKKKLIGVITEGDILKSLIYRKKFNATANSIMNKSFKFSNKKDQHQAKKIFKKYLCPIIPIVNDKMDLKGLLTLKEYLGKLKN